MKITATKKTMPETDLRGRPSIYRLQDLGLKEGLDLVVSEKGLKSMRGKIFASASYYGIKIRTAYAAGVLTVWRIS